MEEKKKKTVQKEGKEENTKKKTTKKVAPKKTTVKASPKKDEKVVKKVREEDIPSLPVEEPLMDRFKRFVSSYQFLYSAFAFLLVLVLILAVMVYTTSRDNKDSKKSNIVFSIMEKNTNNSINVGAESLVGNEYALKVTNYRSGRISDKSYDYKIHVVNNTNAKLIVKRGEDGENLMTDEKDTMIEGKGLGTTKKEDVIYYFTIDGESDVKSSDFIQIEVIS